MLADYAENQISGTRIRQDMHRLAGENRGDCVAVEWQGPRAGYVFLVSEVRIGFSFQWAEKGTCIRALHFGQAIVVPA